METMHMNIEPVVPRAGPDTFARLRLLTRKEVLSLVPYTAQHIYRLERAGKFPRRVRVGENRVAWRQIDIEEWLQNRAVVMMPEPIDE